MPFNGTGTFTRVHNWTQDKDNNIPITASRFDAEDSDFATGLSTCITKDGQTTLTANIPFNSQKITSLGTGNARTDSINLGQVQDNQFLDLGTTGGTADAYIGSTSPVVTAYVSTMRFTVKFNATNLTTTPYFQLGGIANPASNAIIKKIDILNGNEIALEVGDCVVGGIGDLKRNTTNDAWILLNPRNLSSGSFSNLSVLNLTVGQTLNGGAFSNKQVVISNNASDANNNIDFSSGSSFDKTNNVGWASTAITKRLNATWAAGNGNGGLDAGTKAINTWYYCYSIYNPTTNVNDAIFSASPSAPTLPSGYTRYSAIRAGQILTDGSGNIRQFFSDGIMTLWKTPVQSVNATDPGTSAILYTLRVPAGLKVIPVAQYTYRVDGTSVDRYALFTSPDQDDSLPSISNFTNFVESNSEHDTFSGPLRTNTSAQIRARTNFSNANTEFYVFVLGWIDNN